MANLIERILPELQKRLDAFNSKAKQVAVRRTGALQESITTEILERGSQLVVKIRYNIYGLQLYYMSITGYRRSKKSKKGNLQKLPADGKIEADPKKYQQLKVEEAKLADELNQLAIDLLLDKSIDVILKTFDKDGN